MTRPNYLRSIVVYIWAFIFIVFCQPIMWHYRRVSKSDFERGQAGLGKVARWFAGTICAIAGVKIEVEGIENIPEEGSVLFTGNHQSMFDIPVILSIVPRPIGFVAKEEISKVPVFSSWILAIHSFFLPREESRKSLEIILNAAKLLKENSHGLVIFPEGTRSDDGNIRMFKSGSLKIASKSNASVVPFAIENDFNVMPRGTVWFTPQTVRVTFFQAYTPELLKEKGTGVVTMEIVTQIAETIGCPIPSEENTAE